MATIKSFTDLPQSKTLSKILPLESADMVYLGIHQGMDGKYHLSGTNTEDDVVPIYKNFFIKVFAKTTSSDVINQLPCWSLAALLGVLPNGTDIVKEEADTENEKYMCTVGVTNDIISTFGNNPVDACVAMIEKLHELERL